MKRQRTDYTIEVSYQWVKDATRLLLRHAKLSVLVSVMLKDLPKDIADHWAARIRAIDNESLSHYDGRQSKHIAETPLHQQRSADMRDPGEGE